MATDYYELLGVHPSATDDDLKKAYRGLARELHPDTNGDPAAHERFKEISLAYETLRDPERRRRYDRFGPEGVRAGAGAADPFGFAGGSGLGDIFEAFFGGSGFTTRGRGPSQGPDLETVLDLGFEESVFGIRREVEIRAPVVCSACEGSGAKPGTYPSRCTTCNGAGEVRRVRQSILGQMVTAGPCPACGGAGQAITNPCVDCRGEGRRTEEKTYEVDVPAGVDDGTQLRLPGRGGAGPRGGPNGDLYLHVRVAGHELFRREGQDLVRDLGVAFTQAALGAHLKVTTLDGEEDLALPPGTQNGRVFALRGRGVPAGRGRPRGDLLVRVLIETPSGLSRAEDELLRQLADLRGEEVAPADSGFLSRIRSAFK